MKELNANVGSLSREQFVRFAGAVHDFNPIHFDDEFARAAGLPGVIAQGPLSYLVALDALIAANGTQGLSGFAVRLKSPVLPGTPLTVTCTSDGKVSLRAGDAEALSGTALAAAKAPR
jgi:acyl dehydratase